MAIGRISGGMLESNLQRNGVDLAVESSLLYFDVTNNRIGINTDLRTATFTGSISGTVLTVIPPVSGTILIGMTITGTGVLASTKVVSGSGTAWVVSQIHVTPLTGVSLTGSIAPNYSLVVSGLTNITSTQETYSETDGAFVVAGGVGILKDLRVGGDIYTKGQKVATLSSFTSKRKVFSFDIPTLATGATFSYVAPLGYANLVYKLSVTAPVKVQVFSSAAAAASTTAPNPYEPNPYTFIASSRRTFDDGTIYFSDGTSMQTRQYSVFSNLDEPLTKNIYFRITGINDIHGGWPASDLSYVSTFSGSITGDTLTVSGTVTGRPIAVGMTITGPSGIVAATVVTSGSGTSWKVDKTYTSAVSGSMTGTILTNTLTLRYVDSAGDGGTLDVSTVSSLPSGYNGQVVYLTTTNTLQVYSSGAWRAI
jgi:hypothetical protein